METSLPHDNVITTHRQAKSYGQELLRRTVLEAASHLLVEQGPAALTVRKIAQELGCSTKIIYTMFQGKDGLSDALYIDGCERLRLTLEAVPDEENTAALLYRLGQAYWDFALANSSYYKVLFCEAIPGFQPSTNSIHMAGGAFVRLLRVLERAQERGELFETDPWIAAKILGASAHGVVSLLLLGHLEKDLARMVFQQTIQITINSLINVDAGLH